MVTNILFWAMNLVIFLFFAAPSFIPKKKNGKELVFTLDEGETARISGLEHVDFSAWSNHPFKITDGRETKNSEEFTPHHHLLKSQLLIGQWSLTEGDNVNIGIRSSGNYEVIVTEPWTAKLAGIVIGLAFVGVILFFTP